MDTGSIAGEVVDAASQTPVGGARVTLVKIVEVAVERRRVTMAGEG
jgi:hypothetical protein